MVGRARHRRLCAGGGSWTATTTLASGLGLGRCLGRVGRRLCGRRRLVALRRWFGRGLGGGASVGGASVAAAAGRLLGRRWPRLGATAGGCSAAGAGGVPAPVARAGSRRVRAAGWGAAGCGRQPPLPPRRPLPRPPLQRAASASRRARSSRLAAGALLGLAAGALLGLGAQALLLGAVDARRPAPTLSPIARAMIAHERIASSLPGIT